MYNFIRFIDKKDKSELYLNVDSIQYIAPYTNSNGEKVSHIKITGTRDGNFTPVDFDLDEEETKRLFRIINS